MARHIEIDGKKYAVDHPIDISIPLMFGGAQPSAFGVDAATSVACEYGSLVGDTRRGGSCNFERVTFIPHCNGTHTECVGHLTDERISVRSCLKEVLITALLVSVEPTPIGTDTIITRPALEAVIGERAAAALIIRTLPNSDAKLAARYDTDNIPAYFAPEAMDLIVEYGFRHLLVDLPSIDRLLDDGKLVNHRIFWNVEEGSREINDSTRVRSTITEMIYVPDVVGDGEYLLDLQLAPFESDAAPSRPVLLRRA
jgi:arylformamidase